MPGPARPPFLRVPILAAWISLVGCGARTGLAELDGDAGVSARPDSSTGEVVPFCTGSEAKLIYGVAGFRDLVAFDPATRSFRTIGKLDCPLVDRTTSPWALAVDHLGVAHVLFANGEHFEASLVDARCRASSAHWPTGLHPDDGLDFVRSADGDVENLYFATRAGPYAPVVLKRLEASGGSAQTVSTLDATMDWAHVFGGPPGRMFAAFRYFNSDLGRFATSIAEIDIATGRMLSRADLPSVCCIGAGSSFPVAYLDGAVYMFAGGGLMRFRPATGALDLVGPERPDIAVSVSPCARDR
jgi:hypothetical protein